MIITQYQRIYHLNVIYLIKCNSRQVVANNHVQAYELRDGHLHAEVKQQNPSNRVNAGYWTEPENILIRRRGWGVNIFSMTKYVHVKLFFNELARKRNFDPDDIASWYDVTIRQILEEVLL